MNLRFTINDYILIWNLLFNSSVNEEIHRLKKNLWLNHKQEYNSLYKEKTNILEDPKNYIPNNDVLFNLVADTKEFARIKTSIERYRIKSLKTWDENKKEVNNYIKEILKFDLENYNVFCIYEKFATIEIEDNCIILGKKIQNEQNFIIELVYKIVKKLLLKYKHEYKEIAQAILELAIINEFSTRLKGISTYITGDETIKYLKRQIYPYWLMYLGISKENMKDYMVRDRILFEVEKYAYEKELAKLNLYEFIDFCIRHQRHIVNINQLEVI